MHDSSSGRDVSAHTEGTYLPLYGYVETGGMEPTKVPADHPFEPLPFPLAVAPYLPKLGPTEEPAPNLVSTAIPFPLSLTIIPAYLSTDG